MTPGTAQTLPARSAFVFDRSWHALPNNVSRSCRVVLEHIAGLGLDEAALSAVGAAVTEATTNVVYHAYVGRGIGQFRITVELAGDQIGVTVDDDGCGFAADQDARPGRGLLLVAGLAERVESRNRDGGGARVAMWFARG